MKRKNLLVIILFSTLSVLLLAYFVYTNDNGKGYQWQESYKPDSDQPYGTMFIQKLLAGYRPGDTFLLNDKKPLHKLLDSSAQHGPTDYVFIGQTPYYDDADVDALLKFIRQGNDAFIASNYLPLRVIDSVFTNECGRQLFLEENQQKSVTLNFYHTALRTEKGYQYAFRYGKRDYPYAWHVVNREVFCDSVTAIVPLGYAQPDQVNFCKIPYGNGNLYIHSNPIVFTNYFLSQRDKPAYVADVFSHLNGKAIVWDEFSKSKITGEEGPHPSPLSYFLEQPSLKYAWWIILVSALLYTVFTAKRKQRIIPVLEEKVNTSLEFVKMVSALHFQNGNHMDIARKKMKYFLYFVRAKYGIYAQNFTEAHMKRLAEKSTVSLENIQLIFNEFHQMDRNVYNNPASDRLVRLYNAIDNFYKHCK